MDKHEWRKQEKDFYLPKCIPSFITVPPCNYFSIKGSGNPNDPYFAEYIEVLFSLSYALKMSLKKDPAMNQKLTGETNYDYTVYPLEGVWDILDETKRLNSPVLDKNTFVFDLMIRQPDFVTQEFANMIIKQVSEKKPHPLLSKVQFSQWEEGLCIHMLHVGAYDNEAISFREMENFAHQNNVHRIHKAHREIYLTDARRTLIEKQKTVLRFQVIE